MLESWRRIMVSGLDAQPNDVAGPVRDITTTAAWGVLPLLGVVLAVAVAANVGQVGLLFLPQRLAPRLDALSPAKGFSRIYSGRAAGVLVMNLAKFAVAGLVGWLALRARLEDLLLLPALETAPAAARGSVVLMDIAMKMALALLVLGLVDYAWQRWRHEQELRMTRQQLQDELKLTEGDPQMKARRRRAGIGEDRRNRRGPAGEKPVESDAGAPVLSIRAASV
jgi:flagellar biosynthetic protein FlhB